MLEPIADPILYHRTSRRRNKQGESSLDFV